MCWSPFDSAFQCFQLQSSEMHGAMKPYSLRRNGSLDLLTWPHRTDSFILQCLHYSTYICDPKLWATGRQELPSIHTFPSICHTWYIGMNDIALRKALCFFSETNWTPSRSVGCSQGLGKAGAPGWSFLRFLEIPWFAAWLMSTERTEIEFPPDGIVKLAHNAFIGARLHGDGP